MLNRFNEFGLTEPSSDIIRGYSDNAKLEIAEILKLSAGDPLKIDDAPFGRKTVEGYTIDGAETQDRDDGIAAYRSANGGYFIEGSIADVSTVMKPFSELDLQALEKGESEYLPNETVHMLPIEIINNILSLDGEQKRLVDTYRIELDSDGNFLGVERIDAIFYNKKAYSYDSFDIDFNDKESENYKDLQLFYEIMLKLKSKNKLRGEISSDVYDKYKMQNGGSISNKIIEEFMKMINYAANIYANKNNIKVANRNHMPNYRDKKFVGGEMDMAFYHKEMLYHYGLKYDNYMHITSPIRRYADLLSVRELKAYDWGMEPVYNEIEHEYAINFINKRNFLVRGKVIDEFKKYEVKKQTLFKHKAIKGDINQNELALLNIETFESVINYFLGQKVFKLPEKLSNELIIRINNNKINDDLLILIYLSGNKKYNDLVFEKLNSKYENPNTYILKYIDNYSPIEDNIQKFGFGDKGFKLHNGERLSVYQENEDEIDVTFDRIGYIKYNGELLKSFSGNYSSNSEGKRQIRKSLCNYLVDTKINFSKQILDMKNYDIQDIVLGKYSKANLSRISLKNFEDILIHFIVNDIDFDDNLLGLIYDRINMGLLLSDISISFLIFSKNDLFLGELLRKISEKKATRNLIKFLNMNKHFQVEEDINEENKNYSIKIYYFGQEIIDFSFSDLDESNFIDNYVDIINYSRLIVLDMLLKNKDIDFFRGVNLNSY